MCKIEDFIDWLNTNFDVTFTYTIGKKYIRVCRTLGTQVIVYCFVDKTNGNIYKAASYTSIAKHIRGNIESPKDCCEIYGIKYLR